MSAVAPTAGTSSSPRQSGSSVTVAAQMFGADFLKLRKKRSILIWALVLALAPIVIMFVVEAIQQACTASTTACACSADCYLGRSSRF